MQEFGNADVVGQYHRIESPHYALRLKDLGQLTEGVNALFNCRHTWFQSIGFIII